MFPLRPTDCEKVRAVAVIVYVSVDVILIDWFEIRHTGAVFQVFANVTVHAVAEEPTVTSPCPSVPTIDGAVPQEESAGEVLLAYSCPTLSMRNSDEVAYVGLEDAI